MHIDVQFIPDQNAQPPLDDRWVIVIDVLRATTTIVHALATGCASVVPCAEVDEARRRAKELEEPAVLGGERGGQRIDGFDLGNSPCEYTAEAIAGKTLVFTTTNGTRALLAASDAQEILLGAFVNLTAVARASEKAEHLTIVCAGTGGRISREDVLCAGAIIDRLAESLGSVDTSPSANMAHVAWRSLGLDLPVSSRHADSLTEWLSMALANCRGGRDLVRLGLEADITTAARVDSYELVPRFEAQTGRVLL